MSQGAGWLFLIGMWIFFGLGIMAAAMYLQYLLSKAKSKWLGLVLPLLMALNMLSILITFVFEDNYGFLEALAAFGANIAMFLVLEAVFLFIYFKTRKKTAQKWAQAQSAQSYNDYSMFDSSYNMQAGSAEDGTNPVAQAAYQSENAPSADQQYKRAKLRVFTAVCFALLFPIALILFIASVTVTFSMLTIVIPYLIGFFIYIVMLFKDIITVTNKALVLSCVFPFVSAFLKNSGAHIAAVTFGICFIAYTSAEIMKHYKKAL